MSLPPLTFSPAKVEIPPDDNSYFPLRRTIDLLLSHGKSLSVRLPVGGQGNTLRIRCSGDQVTETALSLTALPKAPESNRFRVTLETESGKPENHDFKHVDIPIQVIPILANEIIYLNHIVLDKKIRGSDTECYSPAELAQELDRLHAPDVLPTSERLRVLWIKGPYGSGKSLFIYRLQQILHARSESQTPTWLIINLSHLACSPTAISRSIMVQNIFEQFAHAVKRTSYSSTSGKPATELSELFQPCLLEAKEYGYKGIVFVVDEFDQFWDRPWSDDCQKPIEPTEVLKLLLEVMNVSPSRDTNVTSDNMPAVLVIADYKSQEERADSYVKNLADQPNPPSTEKLKFTEYVIPSNYAIEEIKCLFDELILPPRMGQEDVTGAVNRIYDWTKGHRTCTNRLLFEYLSCCYDDRGSDSDPLPKVDAVFSAPEARKRIIETVDSLWHSGLKIPLSLGEDAHTEDTSSRNYRAHRTPQSKGNELSERNLLRRILEGKELPNPETMTSAQKIGLKALMQKGLISNSSQDGSDESRYHIACPLLRFGMESSPQLNNEEN